MDKILITSFRDEIANAILNMQDKLNPNKDAYIDKKELKGILDFFGVDDVSKLLKTSSSDNSVFENTKSSSEEQTNEDTIEFSKYKPDEDDAINTYGTAANKLDCIAKKNLALSSAGEPFAQQLDALEREKEYRLSRKGDVTDILYKIDSLNELVEDYMNEHPEADKKNLIIKKISYGKNNEKKAIISQSFGISGNNTFDKKSETDSTDGESEISESSNSTNADVNYNIDFRTLNGKDKGDWHFKATINAGSNNSDLHGAFQYTKQFKNSGVLNFTGNIRETIKDKQNIGNFGASVDYRMKKFSTGAYAMYTKDEDITQKSYEIFGKYSKTLIASVGVENDNGAVNYYYATGLLQGKKDFENIGLSINGGIGGEYGVPVYDLSDSSINDLSQKYYKIRVKGGISFKSKDLSADLSADLTRTKATSEFNDISSVLKTTTASFVGNVSTKNIDISTTVSSIKVDTGAPSNEDTVSYYDNKPSISASITLGIKNVFGKNVMPILKYNVGNYDGASQNIGAGIIVTP